MTAPFCSRFCNRTMNRGIYTLWDRRLFDCNSRHLWPHRISDIYRTRLCYRNCRSANHSFRQGTLSTGRAVICSTNCSRLILRGRHSPQGTCRTGYNNFRPADRMMALLSNMSGSQMKDQDRRIRPDRNRSGYSNRRPANRSWACNPHTRCLHHNCRSATRRYPAGSRQIRIFGSMAHNRMCCPG